MPAKPPSLSVLVAITTLNPFALNVLQPALPDLTRIFATDYGTVQLALALFLIASALAQIVIGPICDQIGRRPTALGGCVVFIAGTLACMAATSIGWLVAARIVQAAGGIAGFVVARAVVRDLYERDEAASKLGYVVMAMVLVPMVAPLIGGWLTEFYGYGSIFALTVLFGAIVLAFAWFDLSETQRVAETGAQVPILSAYGILLRSRAFLAHSMTMGFTSASFFTFLAGAPYVVVELQKQGPAVFGLWWISSSAAFMIGNFVAGRIGRRFGAIALMRIGLTSASIGVALVAAGYALHPQSTAVLFLASIPCWFGSGISLPGATASALSVRPDLAGAASGLSGAIHLGAGSLTALLVSHILTDSAWPMIVMMACTASAAILAHLSSGEAGATWRNIR